MTRTENDAAESAIKWQRVNDESFEYAIQQGWHGDEFVKLLDGTFLRRHAQGQTEADAAPPAGLTDYGWYYAESLQGWRIYTKQPGETKGHLVGLTYNITSADFICEIMNTPPPEISSAQRWRHKKRGSTYVEIGRGKLQTTDKLIDMDAVVVYRSEADGSLWVRPEDEFQDGRFEALAGGNE